MTTELSHLLHQYHLPTHLSEKVLTTLSTGRAYTAIELARSSRVLEPDTNRLLALLCEADLVKIRHNRRRQYFYLPEGEFKTQLYAILTPEENIPMGMKFCRHCYQHLAGYVGVKLEEALVQKGYIIRGPLTDDDYGTYTITKTGWQWLTQFNIKESNLPKKRSRLTKQCLDFSERRNHIGGQLGDALLSAFFALEWLVQDPFSREIYTTEKGCKAFKEQFDIFLPQSFNPNHSL